MAKNDRPGGGSEAVESVWATRDHSTDAPPCPHLSTAEIAAAVPVYVLITKTGTDRIGRRVYLSLHSAVKATQRAQERGYAASLAMYRVVPHMVGSELHAGGGADA